MQPFSDVTVRRQKKKKKMHGTKSVWLQILERPTDTLMEPLFHIVRLLNNWARGIVLESPATFIKV